MLGLSGLATDVQTLSQLLRYRVNMYKLTEEREIGSKTFSHMVASTLYEKRFGPYYAEPIIAGLDGTCSAWG
jgi:20S proteasome subunit beta 3